MTTIISSKKIAKQTKMKRPMTFKQLYRAKFHHSPGRSNASAEPGSLTFFQRRRIAKIAAQNPDLTYEFIRKILIAQQEARAGKLQPYIFNN